MKEGRFLVSKAKEIRNSETNEVKICPVGRMATSVSLKTAIEMGNRAHYDCVISERRSDVKTLSGKRYLR